MTTTSADLVTAYLPAPPQGSRVTNKERGLRCRHCGSPLPIQTSDMEKAMVILREVSIEHNVSIAQIQSRYRLTEFVDARSCVVLRWREEINLPLKACGMLLGDRDHSTVSNLLKRIPAMDKRLKIVS